jgi:hypothetical protein
MVAVFSFYSAFAAYRVLYLKDLNKGARPKLMDWLAAAVTALSSFWLLLLGFLNPTLMRVGVVVVLGRPVSIVSIVFGLIGMGMGLNSIQGFVKPSAEKMSWWFSHMQGMLASYIAALTAFSAVNLGHWFGAAWWVWLWPTIIGTPAITIWITYYKRKFFLEKKLAHK